MLQDDDEIGVDSDEFDEELEEGESGVQKLKTPLRHTTGLSLLPCSCLSYSMKIYRRNKQYEYLDDTAAPSSMKILIRARIASV